MTLWTGQSAMVLEVGVAVVGSGADMENDDYYGVGFKAFRIVFFF